MVFEDGEGYLHNTSVVLDHPVSSITDVRRMERLIKDRPSTAPGTLVITHFTLLSARGVSSPALAGDGQPFRSRAPRHKSQRRSNVPDTARTVRGRSSS